MTRLVSDACRFGAMNALDIAEYRMLCAKLDEKRQGFLEAAYAATFCLPGDAGMELELLQCALRMLARQWGVVKPEQGEYEEQ